MSKLLASQGKIYKCKENRHLCILAFHVNSHWIRRLMDVVASSWENNKLQTINSEKIHDRFIILIGLKALVT